MAKTKISEFSSTPGNNTDIDGIDIAEGCAPSNINNAIRELMSQLKNQQAGLDGDTFTTNDVLTVSGVTANAGRVRLGEDADNGSNYTELRSAASLASNVTFVLPSADGSANTVLATDGSGNLSFSAITGTGNVVRATSPALTTPDLGTPSAATLTNATGLPIVAGTTGTLSVARGGTGAATAADARTNLGITETGQDTTYAFRANNLSDLASASSARTNLGLGTIATQAASSVSITGGSITGITDLAVADGGTGASSAADARTNLGITATGQDTTYAYRSNNLSDLASASTARTNLGLGDMATQASSSVSISGGSITGITDLAVADGGTGASSAANARTNLGVPSLTGSGASGTWGIDITGAAASATSATTATNLAGGAANRIAYQLGAGATTFATAPTTSNTYLKWDGTAFTWDAPSSSGSVTSVAQTFTGGLISVAGSPITSSGTLALTVAGTSGGIPYFSSGTAWASSSALAANAIMVGGGAGAAPSTVTTGTGVVTALGVNTGSAGAFVVNGGALGTPTSGTLTNATGLPVSTGISGFGTDVATALAINVGSAGAFVVNGGALGTPSSGTVTNLTGTASININGTVGATTQNTAYVTVLRMYGSSSGYVGLQGAAAAGSTTYTLPSADGSSGQFLSTNGSGTLSWATASGGGTPGGSNTQIQFNNSGSFGASANFTWDGTNVQIGATGALRFADTDSSNYVAFKSPGTVASNVTWTLPSADGTNGQALVTNGSGVLSWSTITGTGTVTSVAVSGGTTGLTTSGGPITSSGTITLAGTLAVANGGTGITSFGSGIATWLGTPSSANLAAAVSDETGTGALVFANTPTLVTPVLGTPTSGTLSNCTVDGTNKVGYIGAPQSTNTTVAASDAGKHIYFTGGSTATLTVNTNATTAIDIGTTILVVNNNSGSLTISGAGVTFQLANGSTGNRTVATKGMATLLKVATDTWYVSGAGVT